MEKLFSYGTLQYETVQLSLFGRKLNGKKDLLTGFKLFTVQITDLKVIELSGESIHKILKFTNNEEDVIEGMVFDLTSQELQLSDSYEVADYKRVSAKLKSGVEAWFYVSRDTVFHETAISSLEIDRFLNNKHEKVS